MAEFLTMISTLVTTAMGWFGDVATMVVTTPVLVFGLGIMVLGLVLRLVYSAIRRGSKT